MPIHTCSGIPLGIDALWIYVPNEEIDFHKYWYIRHLRIECYNPTDGCPRIGFLNNYGSSSNCDIHFDQLYTRCSGICYKTTSDSTSTSDSIKNTDPDTTTAQEPYTLPSLKYLFPHVESLVIRNVEIGLSAPPAFIGALTDLPAGVINLEIEHTLIKNIGEIITNSPHLLFLRLSNNNVPITLTHLPPTLIRLNVFHQTFTTTIKAQNYLESVYIILSDLPGIENLNPYSIKDIVIRGGVNPYNPGILHESSEQIIIKHIELVNAQQVYLHYRSIANRIKISEDNMENPIVVAMKALKSNYPRRMAEFMAYIS